MGEESVSGPTGLGAIILAHRFIARSKKSMMESENKLLQEEHGLNRAWNVRQAVLDKQGVVEAKNWDLVKKTLTSARITDALTALKFEVNSRKFTVLRPLGEGGYSQVYEVYNSDKELFALKIVDLKDQTEKTKTDLIKEILFLEKLKNCRYVVRAHEYQIRETEDEHRMFVLMEKGDKDLFHLMAQHKEQNTLSPTRLRMYWEQMLLAVLEVHQANIIHADIKPGNFLSVAGELKIIDFGMACEVAAGQDFVIRHFVSGTRDYMSPEVYAGIVIEDGAVEDTKISIKVTTKADVWALGIILYQTVYGSIPFAQVPGGKLAKIKAVSSMEHPVEFEYRENMDPQLLDTMKRCLEKDPMRRASIEELLVHPYLRPQFDEISAPRICPTCKSSQKAMAKVNHRRIRNAHNLMC